MIRFLAKIIDGVHSKPLQFNDLRYSQVIKHLNTAIHY